MDTEIKEIIGGNFNPYQFGFNNSSNAKDMSIEDVSTEDISMKDVPIEGGFLSLHDDEKKARIIAEEAEHTGKAEEAEIETRAETAVEARTGADAETRMMTETITKVRTEPSEVAEAMVAGTEMGTGTGTWTRTERETASEEKVGSVAMAGANLNDASLAGSSKVFEWLNNIAEELERCRLRNC